jgi:hypothetical protein
MKRFLILAAAILLGSTAVSAGSTVTDVTPANIASQPWKIEVHHETSGNNVWFEVCVSVAAGDSLTRCTARFIIWREEVTARSGRIHPGSSRPDSVATCQVEGEAHEKAQCYDVRVKRDLLRRVTLTLVFPEARGMPAFDAFEIMLGEFVSPAAKK